MEFSLVRQEDHDGLKAGWHPNVQRSGLTFRAAHYLDCADRGSGGLSNYRVIGIGTLTKPVAKPNLPIADHPVDEASAFTPEALMNDVRRQRPVGDEPIPQICFLEFDGDLTDWLVEQKLAVPFRSWACFHTTMFAMELEGVTCGVIARTIGGPYAVLIAEQLHTAGARLIVGVTSAGRVAADLPIPGIVVAASAIRDEGTSYHYLTPEHEVRCPAHLTAPIARALTSAGFEVRAGKVWTTDAPYRETPSQFEKWARQGALAVEMQAASLFAFAQARKANVAVVARVSNAVDHEGSQFDTGSHEAGLTILKAIARAGRAIASEAR